MDLRAELMPLRLEKKKVAQLAQLADSIDGARPGQWEENLKEFNHLAGTRLAYSDFQGVYGGTDHETWVRGILGERAQKRIPDITREELLELIRRISQAEGKEYQIDFWMNLLEANVPDPKISDLIFWPGEYFGDGDNSRELSPEQILDIALKYSS